MTKILTSALLIISIFGITAVSPALADNSQTKQDQKTQKVKEKVKKLGSGDQAKVKVTLYNETTYQGYVKEANENDFVVVNRSGDLNTVKYSDVKSIGGKNLSTGAKIAIGIGIGVGATILFLAILFASLND